MLWRFGLLNHSLQLLIVSGKLADIALLPFEGDCWSWLAWSNFSWRFLVWRWVYQRNKEWATPIDLTCGVWQFPILILHLFSLRGFRLFESLLWSSSRVTRCNLVYMSINSCSLAMSAYLTTACMLQVSFSRIYCQSQHLQRKSAKNLQMHLRKHIHKSLQSQIKTTQQQLQS